jgi:hypothetical protein
MKNLFQVVNPGALLAAITALERELSTELPFSYKELLRASNGVEWAVHDTGGDCLCLWSSEELIELNEAYQIQHRLPATLAIGSDGGGDAILFDRRPFDRPDEWPVVRVGFGVLDRDEFVLQANNFESWVRKEFRLLEAQAPEFPAIL